MFDHEEVVISGRDDIGSPIEIRGSLNVYYKIIMEIQLAEDREIIRILDTIKMLDTI